jgi:valyl-tRNA synthetase
VNWDPKLQTAISDLEVEQIEVKGNLWHFCAIRSSKAFAPGDFIVVATTRPETMLGDTGVAVHPDDERYKHLVGKHVMLPLVGRDPDRRRRVCRSGEGHGRGEDHAGARLQRLRGRQAARLPLRVLINIFDARGFRRRTTLTCAEAYRGLDRFAARKRIVADDGGAGLLEEDRADTRHMVPHGDRSACRSSRG